MSEDEKVKVRIAFSPAHRAGVEGAHKEGEVVELTPAEAFNLVDTGRAQFVDEGEEKAKGKKKDEPTPNVAPGSNFTSAL